MVLIYQVRSFLAEWKSTEQRVSITWTNCHFGGRRPWFTCSAHTNGRNRQHRPRRWEAASSHGGRVTRVANAGDSPTATGVSLATPLPNPLLLGHRAKR